ncbi:acetylglutamate kinase [Paenibacillus mesophilus]|uniref:acetylglutamate kinase n=1 Tax=Paenibacillus mesophilus TaxID=2582849 RepID=UPI00110E39EA|nr:acetylglutamate kinase [Paenibacillus mesophilus]TMV46437.1 acetylglutamate kinase [Paenibacillus mesophilus]
MDLINEMRTLWEQHVAWTRMLIISIASDLPDEALVTKRLLRNPPDMAAVFRRYYGDEIASQFNKLFTDHLVIPARLVKAAKAGDQKAAAEEEKKWYANADELAAFLSGINPNWSEKALKAMLHEHLKLTKSEAVYRLTKDYAADIAVFDEIEKQALAMADEFANGIVKQFPDRFRK